MMRQLPEGNVGTSFVAAHPFHTIDASFELDEFDDFDDFEDDELFADEEPAPAGV